MATEEVEKKAESALAEKEKELEKEDDDADDELKFLSLRLSQLTTKPLPLIHISAPGATTVDDDNDDKDVKPIPAVIEPPAQELEDSVAKTATSPAVEISIPSGGRDYLRFVSSHPNDNLSNSTESANGTSEEEEEEAPTDSTSSSSSTNPQAAIEKARCPLCNKELPEDLVVQNQHIDICLTEQTLKDEGLLKDQNPEEFQRTVDDLEVENRSEMQRALTEQTNNEAESEELRALLSEMEKSLNANEESGMEALQNLFMSTAVPISSSSSYSPSDSNRRMRMSMENLTEEVERTLEALEQEVQNQVNVAKSFAQHKKCDGCDQVFETFSELYRHVGLDCRRPKNNPPKPARYDKSKVNTEYDQDLLSPPSLRQDLVLSFSTNRELQEAFRDFSRSACMAFESENNVRIVKVDNRKLISQFMTRWRYFKIRYPFDRSKHTPILVFHGTGGYNKDGIMKKGLLIGGRGVRRTTGNAYGTGIYCSVNPPTAKSYAKGNPRCVFVCAALLGKQNDGSYTWRLFYDSNCKYNKNIIVLYTPSQILPLYCIEFQ